MKYVYVASPLSAETHEGIQENIRNAVRYCQYVWGCRLGIPVAPHAYFTQFLDDMNGNDRDTGLREGLKLLSRCDEMYVFAKGYNGASPGMREEIHFADYLGIPITYFDPEIVLKITTEKEKKS